MLGISLCEKIVGRQGGPGKKYGLAICCSRRDPVSFAEVVVGVLIVIFTVPVPSHVRGRCGYTKEGYRGERDDTGLKNGTYLDSSTKLHVAISVEELNI